MWDDEEKEKHQNRLPPGWRLTYAPDWGWFIQPGGTYERIGEFASTAEQCVDALFASGKAVPVLRDDIWVEKGEVKYITPTYLWELPACDDMSCCPNCKAVCPFDYDSPHFVGCTESSSEESFLAVARLKPDATAQSWIEVWNCPCGWRYQMENANG